MSNNFYKFEQGNLSNIIWGSFKGLVIACREYVLAARQYDYEKRHSVLSKDASNTEKWSIAYRAGRAAVTLYAQASSSKNDDDRKLAETLRVSLPKLWSDPMEGHTKAPFEYFALDAFNASAVLSMSVEDIQNYLYDHAPSIYHTESQ